MSRTLAWQPHAWRERLQAALSTGDFSLDSLRERQQVIGELWAEVDSYLIDHYGPGLPVHVMQHAFYTLLATLNQRGTMSRTEWDAAGGGTLFNVDPFHKIVTVTDDQVRLDRKRLLALDPATIYAWHFVVAAAVRDQIVSAGLMCR